jgi:preprotein translocase subunit YajC
LNLLASIVFLAQAAAPTTSPANAPPSMFVLLGQWGPLILIVAVFYFFIFGSKRKTEKQRKEMLNQIKKGDRVQTIGGILGTVVEVRDGDILVKVDESSNAKIRFTRSAVNQVITEEKADAK